MIHLMIDVFTNRKSIHIVFLPRQKVVSINQVTLRWPTKKIFLISYHIKAYVKIQFLTTWGIQVVYKLISNFYSDHVQVLWGRKLGKPNSVYMECIVFCLFILSYIIYLYINSAFILIKCKTVY